MGNFIQVTPFLQARDVDAMVRFYVDVLGFRAWVHAWDYAYVQREAAAVRIGKASEEPEERHEAGPRAFLFYIDVRDVAAVVEEVRPRLLAAGMAGRRWAGGPELGTAGVLGAGAGGWVGCVRAVDLREADGSSAALKRAVWSGSICS